MLAPAKKGDLIFVTGRLKIMLIGEIFGRSRRAGAGR